MKWLRLPLLLLVLMAGLPAAHAQVLIRGDADYRPFGRRVRMEADYIVNQSTHNTGLLRFRLWATEHRWGRGGDRHVLGLSIIPALKPEQRRANIHRTVHLSNPDVGWWFVTLTLEERVFGAGGKKRWEIRDVFEFDEAFFDNPF